MAEYIRRDDPDDEVARGFGGTIGVILAVLVVLALIIGGWFLFFRGNTSNTTINNNPTIQQPKSGETTTGP